LKNKKKKTVVKKKKTVNKFKIFLISVGLMATALTVYIGYRAALSDRKLFSIGLFALFAGLFYESIKVSRSWKAVTGIFAAAYLSSLTAFLPGKREGSYNFENHIEVWPYYLVVIFSVIFIFVYKDKVTAKLTEGITLLLSISFIYWIIDYGFTDYHHWFVYLLMATGIFFSGFSILNALTPITLSRTNRLVLSIWSTIILTAFAFDNIIRVFSSKEDEGSLYMTDNLYIAIQYFLLGVSAVYIIQNFMLLVSFLPSKNGNYKKDLKEIKKDHIERYSIDQTPIYQSLFCIIVTTAVYWLNYIYNILPRHSMIWLVFILFPLLLNYTVYIKELRAKE